MAKYLDSTGVSTLWSKIKGTFLTPGGGDSRYLCYYNNSSTNPQIDAFKDTPCLITQAYSGGWGGGAQPSGSHNGLGILNVHTHVGNYYTQLALDTNQNYLWIRSANNTGAYGSWSRLAMASEIPTTMSWSSITSKPLSGDSGNSGPVWGNYVPVKGDGVMEIGKYLDFHNSSNDGVDYAVRLMCQGDNRVVVNLPTSGGTLALTSQIPTNNNQLTNGAGYITSSGSCSYAEKLRSSDKRYSYPNNVIPNYSEVAVTFSQYDTLGISYDYGYYYDVFAISSYADSSGGNENALIFGKNGDGVFHSRFSCKSDNSWGTPYLFLDSNNYSSYALPLSGGTMTGSITSQLYHPLIFKPQSNHETYIQWLNDSDTNAFEVGIYTGSTYPRWYVWDATSHSVPLSVYNGRVGINKAEPGTYNLEVDGTIASNELRLYNAGSSADLICEDLSSSYTQGRRASLCLDPTSSGLNDIGIGGDYLSLEAWSNGNIEFSCGSKPLNINKAPSVSIGYNWLGGQTTYKLGVNGSFNATTIYQNGTALGSRAFDSTDYLPLSGGTVSGNLILRTSTSNLVFIPWGSSNYIESMNDGGTENVPLWLAGKSGQQGSDLHLNFSNIYATGSDYIVYHSGNFNPSNYSLTSHTHNYLKMQQKSENECIPSENDAMESFHVTSSSTGFSDGYITAWRWSSGGYVTQLYTEVDPFYALYYRYRDNQYNWGSWKRIPMGDGTGASGTWAIDISGTAAAANSVSWSNVGGKPSTFTPSSHTHSIIYERSDARDQNPTPSEAALVCGRGFYMDFVNAGGPSDQGTYSAGFFINPWNAAGSDWSGGGIHELRFNQNGKIYHRVGDGSGWGSWETLITTSFALTNSEIDTIIT